MFNFYRTRSTYWSCSKFADWIRKTFTTNPKPKAATSEGWRDWNKTAKEESRFVYWFTEEFLDKVQNFFMFPLDVWDEIRIYIRNRWITKTHAIVTPLERGVWHENDQLMMHAMFQVLVDYIEIEKASCALWDDDRRKKYKEKMPWWRHLPYRLRFGQWRSRELGLEYLEWEMSLKNENEWDDKLDPEYGKPTRQARSACEQMELYLWWKDVRPHRPDPSELSGYTKAFADRQKNKKEDEDIWDILSEPVTDEYRKIMDKSYEIEESQDQEDQEMLIRLIKIRSHLWT